MQGKNYVSNTDTKSYKDVVRKLCEGVTDPEELIKEIYSRIINRHDSDWDLLILLDKPKLTFRDYDYGYPFREFGWDVGEEISPHIYTKRQWNEWTFLPYHKNVERDKIVLV